jgi:radical SAM protein with 4Fe4S-binding SPASM domain
MIKPIMLDIETSAACQLSCVGCPINYHDGKGFMDLDYYKSIIDRAKLEIPEAGICAFMNGEPTLHPQYLEMIKYTDEAGLKYYFTTNGMTFNEELFRYIIRPGSNCYQIIFSLDGLPYKSSKSIELARPGSDREKILDNISMFGQMKQMSKSKIDMCLKIVNRGQDYAEIEEYIHYWLEKEYVDFVCNGNMLQGKTGGMRYKPCRYSDPQFLTIRYDGEVIACAYHPDPVQFGKLDKNTPLLEFFNNEAMNKFREDQNNGIYREQCKDCGFAFTGYGFDGIVKFRDPKFGNKPIYVHNDYYNNFYSYKLKRKKEALYLDGVNQ